MRHGQNILPSFGIHRRIGFSTWGCDPQRHTRDDGGVRLPFGGRCMVDSIYHNEAAGQFVVTISHYPEVKV